jgi:uncharacterized DUF497 family protein
VEITFDPAKRERTRTERGLDFADAATVFRGLVATVQDERQNYGEARFISAGWLGGRMVVMVWTPRGAARHMISMRYAHAREERRWRERMD